MSLCIVIVSYRSRQVLQNCLQSLRGYHVVVVDNASTDGSADFVRTEFPEVTLIANSENRGFAAACNQGIRASHEPFILLLNPDVVIDGAGIERLLETMDRQRQAGACGPRFLNSDGSLQPSCRRFPALPRLVLDELALGKLFPRSRFFGDYRMTWWAHDEPCEVNQLMGAALLLRRAALDQVGLLDERFFMYFEEVDICLRLHQAGWRVVFEPSAEAVHQGGNSARQVLREATLYRYRSLCAFYRKHHPAWHLMILKLVVGAAATSRVVVHIFQPAKRAAFWGVLRQLPFL